MIQLWWKLRWLRGLCLEKMLCNCTTVPVFMFLCNVGLQMVKCQINVASQSTVNDKMWGESLTD